MKRNKATNKHLRERPDRPSTGLRRRLTRANLIAAVVAVAVFALAWTTRGVLFFGDVSDALRDHSLAMQADGWPQRRLNTPIIFLTIDDPTYEKFGRPVSTPRSALAALLSRIASKNPLLIVLDASLAEASSAEDDRKIKDALGELAQRKTNLLIVRPKDRMGASDGTSQNIDKYNAEMERSPTFQWVTSKQFSGSGGAVRRMASWVAGCAGSAPMYFPGVALAADAVFERASAVHREPLAFPKPDWSCTHSSTAPNDALREVALRRADGKTVDVHPREYITYTMRWHDGRPVPPAIVLSTWPFLNARDLSDYDYFRNSIVIVGGSYSASGDFMDTPLGDMPGGFVLLNAIRGAIDYGPEPGAPFWESLFIALTIAFVTASLMVWAGEAWGPWIEIPLPIIVVALWSAALVFAIGGGVYFGVSLAPEIVALTVLALPHRLPAAPEPHKRR